ncbi:hypothetical protein AVEN_193921-1 [Araneus ventricosus]|uniref:Uncharacterized protein n=1 Tax=Araneus ventricosus TaxID=182803 RepID=A0A4Y2JU16_ARAVE|nr:hypothetical protein AVEN_193921-1 [Araneus ventricosus]
MTMNYPTYDSHTSCQQGTERAKSTFAHTVGLLPPPIHRRVLLQWWRDGSAWNCVDRGRIVFNEESVFQLCPNGHRRFWRPSGQLREPATTIARHTSPQKDLRPGVSFLSLTGLLCRSFYLQHKSSQAKFYKLLCCSSFCGTPGLLFNKTMPDHRLHAVLRLVFEFAERFL